MSCSYDIRLTSGLTKTPIIYATLPAWPMFRCGHSQASIYNLHTAIAWLLACQFMCKVIQLFQNLADIQVIIWTINVSFSRSFFSFFPGFPGYNVGSNAVWTWLLVKELVSWTVSLWTTAGDHCCRVVLLRCSGTCSAASLKLHLRYRNMNCSHYNHMLQLF